MPGKIEPVSLVHAILGIRAWPTLARGRADAQDRMDLMKINRSAKLLRKR